MASSSNHSVSDVAEAEDTNKPAFRISPLLVQLLELAIYSFACLAGLRSSHHTRGEPVFQGIAAMFGQLMKAASAETQAEFQKLGGRWGNWQPGQHPTKELSNYISTKIRNSEKNGYFRKRFQPQAPSFLYEEEKEWNEETERVTCKIYPTCWRCGSRCGFCELRKGEIPKATLGMPCSDLLSPFLDVFDTMIEGPSEEESSQTSDSSDIGSEMDEDELKTLKKSILSKDIDLSSSESAEEPSGEEIV